MNKILKIFFIFTVASAACGPRLNLIEKRELKQSFYNVGRYADPKDWAADWVASYHKDMVAANVKSIFNLVLKQDKFGSIQYDAGDISVKDLRDASCDTKWDVSCDIINLEVTAPYKVCTDMESNTDFNSMIGVMMRMGSTTSTGLDGLLQHILI